MERVGARGMGSGESRERMIARLGGVVKPRGNSWVLGLKKGKELKGKEWGR